jgi:Fe2+ or Zn2+ uptake regulation protein
MRAEEMLEKLVAHGYRATEPRQALLEVIACRSGWFSVRELCEDLGQKRIRVGRATIFRTLSLLVDLGLLERVRGANEVEGYVVTGAGEHHHHLICSRCGRVEELPECPVAERLTELAAERQFQVVSHSLEVYGVCIECLRQESRGARNNKKE